MIAHIPLFFNCHLHYTPVNSIDRPASVMYYTGRGVEQDYDTAIEYYRKAADQGLPVAIFAVGDCYYLGNGAEKDIKQAEK